MRQMSPIKILYVLKTGDYGGVQTHVLNLVKGLDSDLFHIAVCMPQGPLSQFMTTSGAVVHHVDFVRYRVSLSSDIITWFKLFKLIRRDNYDIIHAHSSKPGVMARTAARICRVPCIVYTPHLFHFKAFMPYFKRNFFKWIEQLLSRLATDMVVSVSQDAAREVVSDGVISADKIVTIPNGIDVKPFAVRDEKKQRRIRKDLKIPYDAVVVGMVARLMYQKAPEEFLKVASLVLKNTTKRVIFLLIGDGELRPHLEKICEAMHLTNSLYMIGTQENIPDILQAVDIYLLTSRWEGLPITILEAMAAGLPVIASNIPGNNELVIHGLTGMLYPPGDLERLAEQILNLISNIDLRLKMGLAGQKIVNKNYTIERMVHRTQELYLKLLIGS
jgi:glycosyltransferase involved in cell wall biosynthesis